MFNNHIDAKEELEMMFIRRTFFLVPGLLASMINTVCIDKFLRLERGKDKRKNNFKNRRFLPLFKE